MLPQLIILGAIVMIVSPTIRKETKDFGNKILKTIEKKLKEDPPKSKKE